MKKRKHFLMILAGAALLSMVAVEANAKPKDEKAKQETSENGSKKETPAAKANKVKGTPKTTENKPKAKPESKPKPKANAKPESKPKPKANAKPESKPKPDKPDEAKGEEKKSLTFGVVDWILMSLGATGVILAVVLLVYVIILRKGMREMDQRALEHAAKSNNLEKAFGDKLKLAISSAVADAVREKNPILSDYDELREQTIAAQQALKTCQNDLNASRTACDEANGEVSRLTSELDTVNGNLSTLQQNFDACSKDLTDERAKSDTLQKTVEKYETVIDKSVLEMFQQISEDDPVDRSVLLGLAKMKAMRDAEVDARNILREFQSFDVQLNMIVRDQEMLQAIREVIQSFVEGLLNNEYRISWPKIGANISEYNQSEELDLDESESGTTIKTVKCATIRFADADGAIFQKAKVICD